LRHRLRCRRLAAEQELSAADRVLTDVEGPTDDDTYTEFWGDGGPYSGFPDYAGGQFHQYAGTAVVGLALHLRISVQPAGVRISAQLVRAS
jgi:hypothetical protein